MGGAKNKNLNAATNAGDSGATNDKAKASSMESDLTNTRAALGAKVSNNDPANAIQNNATTGGYDPNAVKAVNDKLDNSSAIGSKLASTAPVSQQQITDASNGRGRETYQNFADTGGLSDADKSAYLRTAGRAATAGFAANKDEMGHRLALQGGYSPGYTSSQANLDRAASQKSAEARTAANSDLAGIIAKNKLAGAEGLATTRTAAGDEALKSQAQTNDAAYKGGQLNTDAALGQSQLQTNQATGIRAGGQQLLDYYKANLSSMSDQDKLQIENRLATLGFTKAQIDAQLGAAGQRQNALQQVAAGVGIAGKAASAIGSIPTGGSTLGG